MFKCLLLFPKKNGKSQSKCFVYMIWKSQRLTITFVCAVFCVCVLIFVLFYWYRFFVWKFNWFFWPSELKNIFDTVLYWSCKSYLFYRFRTNMGIIVREVLWRCLRARARAHTHTHTTMHTWHTYIYIHLVYVMKLWCEVQGSMYVF